MSKALTLMLLRVCLQTSLDTNCVSFPGGGGGGVLDVSMVGEVRRGPSYPDPV